MKRCPGCGKTRSFSEFYRERGGRDGLSWGCKVCGRDRKLQERYGLSMSYVDSFIGKPCPICGALMTPSRDRGHGVVVDEDPITRQFRGIICNNCNRSRLGLNGNTLASIQTELSRLKTGILMGRAFCQAMGRSSRHLINGGLLTFPRYVMLKQCEQYLLDHERFTEDSQKRADFTR